MQNVVFDIQKRGPSCPNWGQGGGLGNSGNAWKKTFFFLLMSSLRRQKNKEMAQMRRRIFQKDETKNIVIRGRGMWKCQFDGLRPWEGKLYGPLVWSIEAVVALPQPFALTAASNHLSPADWISSPVPSLDLIVRLFFKLYFYYQMYSSKRGYW